MDFATTRAILFPYYESNMNIYVVARIRPTNFPGGYRVDCRGRVFVTSMPAGGRRTSAYKIAVTESNSVAAICTLLF